MGFENFNDRQNLIMQGFAYIDVDQDLGNTITEVIDKSSDEYLKELIKGDDTFNHITITDVKNNNPKSGGSNSGLYAISFVDEIGDIAISYRGTENLKLFDLSKKNIDQLDNYASVFLPTSRQIEEAITFFDKNKRKKNYLYGHSKGGNLAQEVFSRRYDEIKKVYVINPCPIDYSKLNETQKKQFNSDKMNVIVIGGDFVSSFGIMPYHNRIRYVRCMKEYKKGFVDPHQWKAASLNGKNFDEVNGIQAYLSFPLQAAIGIFLSNVVGQIQASNLVHIMSTLLLMGSFATQTTLEFNEAMQLVKDHSSEFIQLSLDSMTKELEEIYKLMRNIYGSHSNLDHRYSSDNFKTVIHINL